MKKITLVSMLTVALLIVSGFAAVLAAELSIFSPDAWGVTFRDGTRLAIVGGPQGQSFAKSVGGTTPFCLCDGTNLDQPWVLVKEFPALGDVLYVGPGNTAIMVGEAGAPAVSCPCESGACAAAEGTNSSGGDTDDGDNDGEDPEGEDPDGEDPDGEDPDDDDPDDGDNGGGGEQNQEQNQEQTQQQNQQQTGPSGNSGGENPEVPKKH